MKITAKQLEEVRVFIKLELLKRGFTAPFTLEESTTGRHNEPCLRLIGESFQTVPVLFQEINLEAIGIFFSSKETYNEKVYEITNFGMRIHCNYRNFSGGTNGTEIIHVSGELYQEERVHKLIAR